MKTTPSGSTDASPQTGYSAPGCVSPFASRGAKDRFFEERLARLATHRARMSFEHSRRAAADLGCIPDDEDIVAEIDNRQMKPHFIA